MQNADARKLLENFLGEKRSLAKPLENIDTWNSWYKGKVASFHNYKIYNGKKEIRMEKQSMQAAKRVCEDWASLLINEKVQIITSSKAQPKLDEILTKYDFQVKENKAVETGFALSMSALVIDVSGRVELSDDPNVPSVMIPEKLEVNVLSAKKIIPITIENNQIIECAFVVENTLTTEVCAHLLSENGTYEIARLTENNKTGRVEKSILATGSKTPLYQIVFPNIVNNLDVDSPYPISIFANAIDTLEALDNKYDSYNNEFLFGRKRVYISAELATVDKETGEVNRTFDPYDPVIQLLPQGTNKDGTKQTLVETSTDQLRAEAHNLAIQDELNYLAQKVGLGNEYYRLEKGRVMTATQVISEKSDTFRNKRRHELPIRRSLLQFIATLMNFENLVYSAGFADSDMKELKVVFDDSIIEDTESQKESSRKDVLNGILSPIEYRVEFYGEDEETATANINKYFGNKSLANRINAFMPALSSGAMTVEQFVNAVYFEDANKAKLIADLTEIQSKIGRVGVDDINGLNLDAKV